MENVTVIKNPSVNIKKNYKSCYLRHALIKIAYELAFLWFGESYLDDPSAIELRAAICDPDITSTDGLRGYVGDAENCDAFKLWSSDTAHHLAYVHFGGSDGIAINVRIFDIYAAVIWATRDAARYLAGNDFETKLRFLEINPVGGNMRHTSVSVEITRLVQLMQ